MTIGKNIFEIISLDKIFFWKINVWSKYRLHPLIFINLIFITYHCIYDILYIIYFIEHNNI